MNYSEELFYSFVCATYLYSNKWHCTSACNVLKLCEYFALVASTPKIEALTYH